MAIPIPDDVRELLQAPTTSTSRPCVPTARRATGSSGQDPRTTTSSCAPPTIAKAKDMRRDPRVALSLTDITNPYRMAAIQGRVVEVRSDEGCRYMDPISVKYTGAPFPSRGPDRVCFVIAVEKAAQRTLSFVHNPGN